MRSWAAGSRGDVTGKAKSLFVCLWGVGAGRRRRRIVGGWGQSGRERTGTTRAAAAGQGAGRARTLWEAAAEVSRGRVSHRGKACFMGVPARAREQSELTPATDAGQRLGPGMEEMVQVGGKAMMRGMCMQRPPQCAPAADAGPPPPPLGPCTPARPPYPECLAPQVEAVTTAAAPMQASRYQLLTARCYHVDLSICGGDEASTPVVAHGGPLVCPRGATTPHRGRLEVRNAARGPRTGRGSSQDSIHSTSDRWGA